MPRPRPSDRAATVSKALRSLALGKKHYKKFDALMDVLEKELTPGDVITLPSGQPVRFVDKFADRNRINVGMNARRYELEEVTLP